MSGAMLNLSAPAPTVRRRCPLCGVVEADTLFSLKAREFARRNWTYVPDFASRLGIDEESEYPIVRCRSCSFAYALYLPSASFVDAVYERVIDTQLAAKASRDPFVTAGRMQYAARLARLRPPLNGEAALDYGCGFGATSRLLAELGYSVVAFDPSGVRRGLASSGGTYLDVVASTDEVKQRAPYVVVVVDNVLEHVPDPIAVICSLASICDANAAVYISVPSYEPEHILRLLAQCRAGQLCDMTLNPWEHLNYFSVAHLDQAMAAGGFVPLTACEQVGPIDIGLRSERRTIPRLKNVLSSGLRMLRYAWTGRTIETVESRIYRRQLQ